MRCAVRDHPVRRKGRDRWQASQRYTAGMEDRLAAPLPWQFKNADRPSDPRRRKENEQQQSLMDGTANSAADGRVAVHPTLLAVPPSADAVKLQQRIGQLRVALEHSNSVASNFQQQVSRSGVSFACACSLAPCSPLSHRLLTLH